MSQPPSQADPAPGSTPENPGEPSAGTATTHTQAAAAPPAIFQRAPPARRTEGDFEAHMKAFKAARRAADAAEADRRWAAHQARQAVRNARPPSPPAAVLNLGALPDNHTDDERNKQQRLIAYIKKHIPLTKALLLSWDWRNWALKQLQRHMLILPDDFLGRPDSDMVLQVKSLEEHDLPVLTSTYWTEKMTAIAFPDDQFADQEERYGAVAREYRSLCRNIDILDNSAVTGYPDSVKLFHQHVRLIGGGQNLNLAAATPSHFVVRTRQLCRENSPVTYFVYLNMQEQMFRLQRGPFGRIIVNIECPYFHKWAAEHGGRRLSHIMERNVGADEATFDPVIVLQYKFAKITDPVVSPLHAYDTLTRYVDIDVLLTRHPLTLVGLDDFFPDASLYLQIKERLMDAAEGKDYPLHVFTSEEYKAQVGPDLYELQTV